MISDFLLFLFNYSIVLAAIIGLFRFHRVSRDNYPFFYIMWIALLSEISGRICTYYLRSTAVNNNTYVLLEALLFIWLFYNWNSVRQIRKFRLLATGTVVVWITDNFLLNSISHTNSMFRIVSSFVLVFLAIGQINQLIITQSGNLLKNSRFLISVSVILYFSYKAIMETFFWIPATFSDAFLVRLLDIMDYVNLFGNLIFALAALWIPTRQKFTLPF